MTDSYHRSLPIMAMTITLIMLSLGVLSHTMDPKSHSLMLYFTVRDFMPSGCMRPNEIDNYWYGSATIRSQNYHWIDLPTRCPIRKDILLGLYSGHPDFETSPAVTGEGCSGTMTAMEGDASLPNFTLASGGISCLLVNNPANPILPMTRVVENHLDFGDDGIPKPVYCTNGPYLRANDRRCGWVYSSNTREYLPSTSGRASFDAWYRDDSRINKRVGFQLELLESIPGSGVFTYSAAQFHPLSIITPCGTTSDQRLDCSNGGRIWPRGVVGPPGQELDERSSPFRTFGFTTELHTFFTFQGNETLEFRGDDDVWIFINERLALDVGGLHNPARSVINLTDSNVRARLGLDIIGNTYALDIFHAERRAVLSSFGLTTSLAPGCTVQNSATPDVAFSNETTTDDSSNWKLIGATWNQAHYGGLLLGNERNSASYAFFRRRSNVRPGFQARFRFAIAMPRAGSTRPPLGGFAFTMHHSETGLSNLNGGTGFNLGFLRLGNALGIAVNITNDTTSELLAVSKGKVLARAQLIHPNDVLDGKTHTINIRYYGSKTRWLEVYLNDDLFLQVRRFDLEAALGNKDSAWIGFTSGFEHTAGPDISIWDFHLDTVSAYPPGTEIVQTQLGSVADGKSIAYVKVQLRDYCGNNLGFGGLGTWITPNISFSGVHPPHIRINDGNDGSYMITLTSLEINQHVNLTVHISNYTLPPIFPIFFREGPEAAESPEFLDEPYERSIPLTLVGVAIAGCFTIIGCIVIAGCIARRRWRANKKFIQPGKQALAEKGVTYNGNTELDILQRRVQESFQALNAERARCRFDLTYEILELTEQVQQIREEIRRLHGKRHQHGEPIETNTVCDGIVEPLYTHRRTKLDWNEKSVALV